ncbi:hypothetical protein AB1K70_01940 [Bremerella sp. JC770]|uniref:hypothetical protein n=1 Tax=Bremerella sp. JC770 TaxID=3232137 RepID=UPI003458D128
MSKFQRKGNASIMSLVLLVVLMAIGVIVGAVALRDHLVQEFGDAAVALDHLDQSFSYHIQIDSNGDGTFDAECMAGYMDEPTLTDPGMVVGIPPAGLSFPFPDPDATESPVNNLTIPGTIP